MLPHGVGPHSSSRKHEKKAALLAQLQEAVAVDVRLTYIDVHTPNAVPAVDGGEEAQRLTISCRLCQQNQKMRLEDVLAHCRGKKHTRRVAKDQIDDTPPDLSFEIDDSDTKSCPNTTPIASPKTAPATKIRDSQALKAMEAPHTEPETPSALGLVVVFDTAHPWTLRQGENDDSSDVDSELAVVSGFYPGRHSSWGETEGDSSSDEDDSCFRVPAFVAVKEKQQSKRAAASDSSQDTDMSIVGSWFDQESFFSASAQSNVTPSKSVTSLLASPSPMPQQVNLSLSGSAVSQPRPFRTPQQDGRSIFQSFIIREQLADDEYSQVDSSPLSTESEVSIVGAWLEQCPSPSFIAPRTEDCSVDSVVTSPLESRIEQAPQSESSPLPVPVKLMPEPRMSDDKDLAVAPAEAKWEAISQLLEWEVSTDEEQHDEASVQDNIRQTILTYDAARDCLAELAHVFGV